MENKSDQKYAVFMITEGESLESIYYFIEYSQNKDILLHLEKELQKVKKWVLDDDLCMYTLDLKHLVSESTVDEMIRLCLNSKQHAKLGKLHPIPIQLKKKWKDSTKIMELNKILRRSYILKYDVNYIISDTDSENSDESSSISHEITDSDDSDIILNKKSPSHLYSLNETEFTKKYLPSNIIFFLKN